MTCSAGFERRILILSSVLAGPDALPGFWLFMYYVSPFTYLVDGMLSTGLANTNVECSDIEFRKLEPIGGTCREYMERYIYGNSTTKGNGGYLRYPNATDICEFCPVSDTNVFLKSLNSEYSHRWRNFGIMWGFIGFNICAALFLYWLARVPKKQKTLESPPNEQASRIPTKASKPEVNGYGRGIEAVKDIQREKEEGTREINGGGKIERHG